MPENIRYGVTITPPDGEPVTGTAIPEIDANENNIVMFAGRFCNLTNDMVNGISFNSNAVYSGVTGTPSTEAQMIFTPTVKGNYLVVLYIAGKNNWNTAGQISINGNIVDTSKLVNSGGKNTLLYPTNATGKFVKLINITDAITIQCNSVGSGGNITIYGVAFYTPSTGLTADNISNGIEIGGVAGTMKKKNSYWIGGLYTNTLFGVKSGWGLLPDIDYDYSVTSGENPGGLITLGQNYNNITTYGICNMEASSIGTNNTYAYTDTNGRHNITVSSTSMITDNNSVTGTVLQGFHMYTASIGSDAMWFGVITQAKFPEAVPSYENSKP